MKMYSGDVVTKEYVDNSALSVSLAKQVKIDEVDAKQTEQIKKLRIMLAISATVNLLVAVGAYFV